VRKRTDDYTAGDLRQPVVVQRVTYTPDGSGGQDKTWADFATIYCFVENKASDERFADGALGRIRTFERWEFTTWRRTDITVEDRLSWNGTLWNIRGVENVLSRNKFLRLIAEAGVEQ